MEKKSSYNFDEILSRGVEEIFVKDHLVAALAEGKKLRIKLGIDPTGPKIHIGRAIVLRKLKAFQDLGHQVVFIVGDFTAQVGDPSDKLEKRPTLSKEKINENLKDYKKSIGKIIDIEKAEFLYNSEWLGKLGFQEISEIAEAFSVQQMSNRRNFKDRLEKGDEISLREFLYPLMQGYDSVAVKADVELGGFDQLFNLKAGRIIQKHFGMPEQDIMVTQMLEGTDGRKMSTSWGNVIAIEDEPNDMFGKIMSVRDDLIIKYFTLCTDISLADIDEIFSQIKKGDNPRDAKLRLGYEIVALYHGADHARHAQEEWIKTFSEGGVPDDIKEIQGEDSLKLVDVLVQENLVSSKSDFRRLVDEGAIKKILDGGSEEKVMDHNASSEKGIYKIGKKKFIKIV